MPRLVRTAISATVCLALLVSTAGAKDPNEDPPSLASLLAELSRSPGISARFVEEKQLTLLSTPIESKGAIYFQRPSRLARHVHEPARSVVLLDEDELLVSEGGKTQRVELGPSGMVRALVESFVLLLAGKQKELEQRFVLHFQSTTDRKWTLRLVPKVPALSKAIVDLDFEGDGLVLSRMRMRQKNGDVTTMAFHDVKTARRFSPAEARRLFSVRKP